MFRNLIPFLFAFGMSSSHAQQDTINLPKKDVLKVLAKGLEGKVYQQQRDSLLRDVTTLNTLIGIKNLEIQNLNSTVEDYKKIKTSCEAQIANMKDQRVLLQAQADNLTKLYKREKRKVVFWKITTVFGTGAAIILYLLK